MGKVKIKDTSQGLDGESRRLAIWTILQDKLCFIHKLIKANNHYLAIADEATIEKIIHPDTKLALHNDHFEVVDPPHLNASRTLVVNQADSLVYNLSEEELKYEIEQRNQVKVTSIIKLPSTKTTFKVKLETTQMVRDCLIKGLLISGQSFPPRYLKQEIHVVPPQCMRCYSYEHIKKNCPMPSTYKICSICASDEHYWTDCNNQINHKCITCSGDHPTMAARCPIRKTLTKDQAKTIRNQQSQITSNKTFAQATASTAPNSSIAPNNNISLHQLTVINTAIITANLSESVEPGTFQTMMDAFYKANGLPLVKIPTEAIKLANKVSTLLNSGNQNNTSPNQPLLTDEDMETEEAKRKRILSDSDSEAEMPSHPAKTANSTTTSNNLNP
ncbi:uncharacterized protein [Macrobrachium rosenbergii]|uniref:uncharacterized protein n=1 Tax=Macrobrachium rosenbergii TaxID=79674 RepID=UPI0034D4FDE6